MIHEPVPLKPGPVTCPYSKHLLFDLVQMTGRFELQITCRGCKRLLQIRPDGIREVLR